MNVKINFVEYYLSLSQAYLMVFACRILYYSLVKLLYQGIVATCYLRTLVLRLVSFVFFTNLLKYRNRLVYICRTGIHAPNSGFVRVGVQESMKIHVHVHACSWARQSMVRTTGERETTCCSRNYIYRWKLIDSRRFCYIIFTEQTYAYFCKKIKKL